MNVFERKPVDLATRLTDPGGLSRSDRRLRAPDVVRSANSRDRTLTDDDRACTRTQKTARLFGRTLAGERPSDVLRLVDFVERESTSDADLIVITGHSGGAAVSLFAAALGDRLAHVASNAYFCTFAESFVAIDRRECNYVRGILQPGEMWNVAGTITPRPLAVVTGDEDPIFSIEGTRCAFSNLQEGYRNGGAADACGLFVGDGANRNYPDAVRPFVEERL